VARGNPPRRFWLGTKAQTKSGHPTPGSSGRNHPIDRILDRDLAERKAPLPAPASEETFVRRAYLDLIGLLPTPEERDAFLKSKSTKKSEELVDELLNREDFLCRSLADFLE
jgi:hypothetical protein